MYSIVVYNGLAEKLWEFERVDLVVIRKKVFIV